MTASISSSTAELPSSMEEIQPFGKLHAGKTALSRLLMHVSLGPKSLLYRGHLCIDKEPQSGLYDQHKYEYIIQLRQTSPRGCICSTLSKGCVCLLPVGYSANEPVLSPLNNLCWSWNIFPVVHQKNWQANKADRCSSDLWGFPGKIVFSLFN